MNPINESIGLVGGGGGVFRVANPLKDIRRNIFTLQTVFDHGKHSGQLRDERGVLPPGDVGQAIVALAREDSAELRALFSYRFPDRGTSSLNQATVRNILIAALTEINHGSLPKAIDALCRIFKVQGKVLPISTDDAELCVTLSDGSVLKGEGLIDNRSIKDHRTIVSAHLEPSALLYVGAYEAIINADKIVFCPGDLYTSSIPNSLVKGFKEAIAETKATLIYAVNIMTKKAETHGFTASRFASTLLPYIGREKFDHVICNSENISPELIHKYKQEEAHPVLVDVAELHKYTKNIIAEPLADMAGGIIRHKNRLAHIIANI
jgi:uncharacterized cofD-like protein